MDLRFTSNQGTTRDWAECLPTPVLSELAACYLDLSDIRSACRVCKRWYSEFGLRRKLVRFLPPTPAKTSDDYPPHLFARRFTTCLLPLSSTTLSSPDARGDHLNSYAAAMVKSRQSILHVIYSADESLAATTRPRAAQLRQLTPSQAYQSYYDLTLPLTASLTRLLWSTQPPGGQHLSRLVLQLASLPQPHVLGQLAALPSLDHLQLLGGRAAFLDLDHLEALAALTRLTGLVLQGVWDMHRPERQHPLGPGPGPGLAGAQHPVQAGMEEEDPEWHGHGMQAMGWAEPGMEILGGPAAAAAAAAVNNGNGEEPWPALFSSLENLRLLHLRALQPLGRGGRAFFLHGDQGTIPLDLYPLTWLHDLRVGGPLNPQLRLCCGLQRLERLHLYDRVLTLAEWETVRRLEGLADVELRSEVAGAVRTALVNGVVHVSYGVEHGGGSAPPHGAVSFAMPAALRFPAGRGAYGGSAVPAWRSGEVLRSLAQQLVRLEPVRLLAELTGLTRLSLRWPGDPLASRSTGAPAGEPTLSWSAEEAAVVRRPYVEALRALGELREVELHCPDCPLLPLDGPLLAALAPAWRHLTRLLLRGAVRPGVAAELGAFTGLKDLELHGEAPVADHAGGERREKLVLATAKLPPRLERLSLTNANIVHVPRVGVPGLQRLSLGSGCRWLATKRPGPLPTPPAPAGAVGGGGSASTVAPCTGAALPWAAAAGPLPAAAAERGPSSATAHATHAATAVTTATTTATATAAIATTVLSPAARASPTTGVGAVDWGPWALSGLPRLTHLRLHSPAAVGHGGLRAALTSGGRHLRALALTLPAEQAYVDPFLRTLAECCPLLPRLVRLEVTVPPPGHRNPPAPHAPHHPAPHPAAHPAAPQQPLPAAGGAAGAAAAAPAAPAALGAPFAFNAPAGGMEVGGMELADAGPPGPPAPAPAPPPVPLPGPDMVPAPAPQNPPPAEEDEWQRSEMQSEMWPLRQLVRTLAAAAAAMVSTPAPASALAPTTPAAAALTSASTSAAASPAAASHDSNRLPQLSELTLHVPWDHAVPRHLAPLPPLHPAVQEHERRRGEVLAAALADICKLPQLRALQLLGPQCARHREPLERLLRPALSHCHIHIVAEQQQT